MNILFYTQYYAPETNAPSNRLGGFAKYLKRNHKITVLTTTPNHPLGKVFDGYKNKWFQKETIDGITAYRSYSYIPKNLKSKKERLLNYFSFCFSSFLYIFSIIKREKIDCIIASTPPLSIAFVGAIVSKLTYKPLILDLRDVWPDAAVSLGIIKKNTLLKLIEKWERWTYKKTKKILVNSLGLKNYLIKYKSVSESQIEYIPNGFDFSLIDDSSPLENQEKFTAMYAGLLGLAQNPLILIDVALELKDYKEIQIFVVGEGIYKEEINNQISKHNLTNIKLFDYMPRQELFKSIQKASLMLVTYKKSDTFRFNIPSKIFEFMALGKPIIINLKGEGAKIITEARAGECITEDSSKELAKTILKYYLNQPLTKELGDNGKEYSFLHFNQEKLADKLDNIIKEITL